MVGNSISWFSNYQDSAPVAFIMNVTQNRSLNRPAKDISSLVFGGNGHRDAIHAKVKQLDGVRGMHSECVVLTN